jgi:hypothetical protein
LFAIPPVGAIVTITFLSAIFLPYVYVMPLMIIRSLRILVRTMGLASIRMEATWQAIFESDDQGVIDAAPRVAVQQAAASSRERGE